jgi:hypothetical protein
MARLAKLVEQANLISHEPIPGTPGVLVQVQLHHDRDRGWWEVTARETRGDRRKTQQRYQSEQEAQEALGRVYALYEGQGRWEVQDYRER